MGYLYKQALMDQRRLRGAVRAAGTSAPPRAGSGAPGGRPWIAEGMSCTGRAALRSSRAPEPCRRSWLDRGAARGRGGLLWGAIGLRGLVSAVIALPVLPVRQTGPVIAMNGDVGETIGWPALARTVARVYDRTERNPVIFTSNYGEAGGLPGPPRRPRAAVAVRVPRPSWPPGVSLLAHPRGARRRPAGRAAPMPADPGPNRRRRDAGGCRMTGPVPAGPRCAGRCQDRQSPARARPTRSGPRTRLAPLAASDPRLARALTRRPPQAPGRRADGARDRRGASARLYSGTWLFGSPRSGRPPLQRHRGPSATDEESNEKQKLRHRPRRRSLPARSDHGVRWWRPPVAAAARAAV